MRPVVVGVVAVALAGCGDEVVQVTLVLPPSAVAAQYDASCVRAVRLDLDGGNYPADGEDYETDCVDVMPTGASFAAVRDATVGKFDVAMPASGLSGVEMYAYSGTCDSARPQDFDLVFYASGAYIGQDEVAIPLVPNVSCAPADVTVRPIDVLKLVATKQCATAAWTEGKLGLSTLSPLPFTTETYWWGGQASGAIVGGVARMRGPTQVGPDTCLAIGLYTSDWVLVTCVPPQDQRVCATGAELEAPMVNLAVANATADVGKLTRWGALVIGAVYNTQPVSGATVTIDAADAENGEVVYFDMPPGVENGTGALTVRGSNATGPSGLFGVYTKSLVHLTVSSGGASVKRTIGGDEDNVGTVIVRL